MKNAWIFLQKKMMMLGSVATVFAPAAAVFFATRSIRIPALPHRGQIHAMSHDSRRPASRRRGVCAALISVLLTIPAIADDAPAPPAVVIELFTSQGCYSCPPAEKLLSEKLATRPGVIALEMHVDYWDDLVYGGSVWADPYSDNAYTRRQTAYNRRIRNTRSIYTPQAVIQGQSQAGGTQESRINAAIKDAEAAAPPKNRFIFDGPRSARLEGALTPGAQAYYAVFWRKRTTQVDAGENKGKTLHNTNVVILLERMEFGKRDIVIPPFDSETQDCAVWLQQGVAGRITSAARCPQG